MDSNFYSTLCHLQVVSPLLCNVMGGQEMSNYLQEEGYIRLIQCFLQPDLMLQRKESPNSLTERQVLELGPDGRPQVIPRQGDQQDPLYQLFIPAQPDDIGNYGVEFGCGLVMEFLLLSQINLMLIFVTRWLIC